MDQPIGLQRLSELHCLEVHSTMSWMSGCKYEIRECSGELLYNVKKERKGIVSSALSFNIALLDVNGVEVISLHKPSSFGMCRVNVSMQGELVSVVRQKLAFLTPKYEVHDANDTPVYRIKAPWCFTTELQFQLSTLDETPLGTITRKWGGWGQELTSARENFIVSFPPSMELRYKAACIAATVLIIDIRRRQRY